MKINTLYNCNSTNPHLIAQMQDNTFKCVRIYNSKLIISNDYFSTGRTMKELEPISIPEYNCFYRPLIEAYNKEH